MDDFIIDHALRNVWCNPSQDNQHVIAPQRLSDPLGVYNRITLMGYRKVSLPTPKEQYHVFQIGQLHPLLIGLFNEGVEYITETWFTFAHAMQKESMIANIYNDAGFQVPLFQSYYMFTRDRDLIIAIKESDTVSKYIDYKHDTLYLRVYTNAWFASMRADAVTDIIVTNGMVVKNNDDIAAIQAEAAAFSLKSGLLLCFVNGIRVSDINFLTVAYGDVVEYVYDSSVKRTVSMKISSMDTFESILDNTYKYLFHYPKQNDEDKNIEYMDDVDFYVCGNKSSSLSYGVYYHKNLQDAVRMVTHRDYALKVLNIERHARTVKDTFEIPDELRELDVIAIIRHSGYNRPLIFENSRLHELYKLNDTLVRQALLGVNSNVIYWRAEELENNYYTYLMRATGGDITREDIQKGYGYNGLSKIIGETPSKTFVYSSGKRINLEPGYQASYTAYEYDIDGKMTGWQTGLNNLIYDTLSLTTALVEVMTGEGTQKPDNRFGSDSIPVPTHASYRVYCCHYEEVNKLDNKWEDITGSDKYRIEDGLLLWNGESEAQYIMVRTDVKFLAVDIEVSLIDGVLSFVLPEVQTRDNVTDTHVMEIPYGEIDLFLNGKSLIEDLDFFVDFPKVFITNTRYLTDDAYNTKQKIHIRCSGFCKSDLTRDIPDDVGFIVHDVLSENNKFDIRDDKVLRIVVDGCLKHRDDLIFSELHNGVSITGASNGKPYQIRDMVVPMRNLVNEETYSMRAKSEIIDKVISDYMTLKLPQPERLAPSAITERYPIYSPFLSKIIGDMVSNRIAFEEINVPLTRELVMDICKRYQEYIDNDPTQPNNPIDSDFVDVWPHCNQSTISLSIVQYKFLTKVVELYCNGLVKLSPFITVNNN